MELTRRQRSHTGSGVCVVLYVSLVLWSGPVSCITVSAPEEINAINGQTVTLSCHFTSTQRLTSKVSIDWSYKPQSGGPSQVIFHFFSEKYLPEKGQFKGRVQWHGEPARGDASIRLVNASLNDNGTYSCAVRNPPDIQGPPSTTILTVSLKKAQVYFSDVAMLLFFILVPSSLIAMVLLARMLCPCCSPQEKSSRFCQHSPIEVHDGEELPKCTCSKEYGYHHPSSKQKTAMCCEISIEESDEECRQYIEKHQLQMEAESQC